MMLPKGYYVLRLPLKASSPFYQEITVKAHEVSTSKESTFPAGRTLFLHQVHTSYTKDEISMCFSQFGKLERVEARTSSATKGCTVYSLWYVVFSEASSLGNLLQTASKSLICESPMPPPHDDVQNWFARLTQELRDPEELNAEVTAYLQEYDIIREMERQRRKSEKGNAVVDESGFTLVSGATTRSSDGLSVHGFKPSTPRPTGAFSPSPKAVTHSGSRKRKKTKGGQESDFYAFQFRETKRTELASMRKQRQSDELTLEKMK